MAAAPADVLQKVFRRLPSYEHIAMAAGSCRAFAAAARALKPSYRPTVLPDGSVREPAAGFFIVVGGPRDDPRRDKPETLIGALERCPAGGTMLLLRPADRGEWQAVFSMEFGVEDDGHHFYV